MLPDELVQILGLSSDTEVTVTLNPTQNQIVITPVTLQLPDIDEEFAHQLAEFIEEYRPALEALAR